MPDFKIFIAIGALLLVGLAMDELGRRTRLPRVTLLVLSGIAFGPSGLNLLPHAINGWYPAIAVIALVMVAFLLGGKLTRSAIAREGRHLFAVSISAVIATAVLVGFGLWLMGVDPILCLVLAAISTATAPAATQDVVRMSGLKGPFPRLLLGIVAIDDAWGLILFSILLATGHAMLGQDPSSALEIGVIEIGGAVLIGLALGFPAAYLTGRLQPGEPSQVEALGLVFLCGGLALATGASYLLAAMVCGLVVANFARHHNRAFHDNRAFHEIENIEWPFMVLFFVLAGASLNIAVLPTMGTVGLAYMVLRIIGRIAGGWLGGTLSGMSPLHRNWIGVALMPQAGVSLGMALIAASAFPEARDEILGTAIATTILFELAGPLATSVALSKTADRE